MKKYNYIIKRIIFLNIIILLAIAITYQSSKNVKQTYSINTEFSCEESNNCYNVVDKYNANGSDNNDDRPAIQSALDKAINSNEIITVYVPKGTYKISGKLNIYSNTILKLDDMAVITNMKANSEDSGILFPTFTDSSGNKCSRSDITINSNGEKIFTNEGCNNKGGYKQLKNITLEGGTYDFNGSFVGIRFTHGQNITIKNVTFQNSLAHHPIVLSGLKDVLITGCTFKNHELLNDYPDSIEDNFKYRTPLINEFIKIAPTDSITESGIIPEDGTPTTNVIIDNNIFDNILTALGSHKNLRSNSVTDATALQEIDNKMNSNITISNNTFTKVHYNVINMLFGKEIEIYGNKATSFSETDNAYGFVYTENTGANIHDNTVNGFGYNVIYNSNETYYPTDYDINYEGKKISEMTNDDMFNLGIIRRYFIIKFNANGGIGTMSNVHGQVGNLIPENTFTRNNYNFIGWKIKRLRDETYIVSSTEDNTTKYSYKSTLENSNEDYYILKDHKKMGKIFLQHQNEELEFIAQWKEIKSISISQSPSKLEYLEGTDEIDLSDGKLLLTYFDNSTEEIPLNKAIVSKFNKNQVGEQTVTINYAGLTTNLTVSVISINIQDESISLSDNIIKINLNRSNKNTGIKCTELTDKITTSNNLVFYNESNEIITNDAIIKNGYILGINDNNNNEIIKIPIIIIGDINSDGIVNINDAKKLAENIITKIELDVDIKKYASDINNDNNVKINDITLLLKNINAN